VLLGCVHQLLELTRELVNLCLVRFGNDFFTLAQCDRIPQLQQQIKEWEAPNLQFCQSNKSLLQSNLSEELIRHKDKTLQIIELY
jgi:hypothetical protein